MAQLTWQNIAAPKLDTRDLALANRTVSDAFSRFGTVLSDRVTAQRDERGNALKAQGLAMNTPEELAAFIASNPGADQNIDHAGLLEGLRNYQAQQTQQIGAQEDLSNKQALTQRAGFIAKAYDAALNGDEVAYASLQTEAETDPMAARALGQINDQIIGLKGERIDNVRDDSRLAGDQTHQRNQDANDRARTGIAAASAAMQRTAFAQSQTDRKEAKDKEASGDAAIKAGRDYANTLSLGDGNMLTDGLRYLYDQPAYKNASAANQEKMASGYTKRSGELLTDTVRSSTSPDAIAVARTVALGNSTISQVNNELDARFRRANPTMALSLDASKPENKDATRAAVIAKLTGSDIDDPEQFVSDRLQRNNTLAEMSAMADNVDLTDRSFLSNKYAGNPLDSAKHRAAAALDDLNKLRGSSAANSAILEDEEQKKQPFVKAAAELARLQKRAENERKTNNGEVKPGTKVKLAELEKRLQDNAQRILATQIPTGN